MKYLVLDTETAGAEKKQLIYDLAYVIYDDKKGEIIEQYNVIIEEIFNNPEIMARAFYSSKVSGYRERIKNKEIEVVPFAEALAKLNRAISTVGFVGAYNFPFDSNNALRNTAKHILNLDKWNNVDRTPFCLWNASCETLLKTQTYIDTARKNEWLSPTGGVKTSAETCYRYLKGDVDFIEAHTALADCFIEAEILQFIIENYDNLAGPESQPYRKVWNIDEIWLKKELAKKVAEYNEIASRMEEETGSKKSQLKSSLKDRKKTIDGLLEKLDNL